MGDNAYFFRSTGGRLNRVESLVSDQDDSVMLALQADETLGRSRTQSLQVFGLERQNHAFSQNTNAI